MRDIRGNSRALFEHNHNDSVGSMHHRCSDYTSKYSQELSVVKQTKELLLSCDD